MRQISLALIAGALILSACDANKPKVKQAENDFNTRRIETTERFTDYGTTVDGRRGNDETLIQAEEVDPRLNERQIYDESLIQEEEVNPRMDERKTYNEKQISDDVNDYPIDKSDYGETYEEKQISH